MWLFASYRWLNVTEERQATIQVEANPSRAGRCGATESRTLAGLCDELEIEIAREGTWALTESALKIRIAPNRFARYRELCNLG